LEGCGARLPGTLNSFSGTDALPIGGTGLSGKVEVLLSCEVHASLILSTALLSENIRRLLNQPKSNHLYNARHQNLSSSPNRLSPQLATPTNPLPQPLSEPPRPLSHNPTSQIRQQRVVNSVDLALRQRSNLTLPLQCARMHGRANRHSENPLWRSRRV
jgi:hypothetical protein